MTDSLKNKINELEDELKNTKVNKRTESAVGLLKGKIARLKEELEQKSSGGKKGEGYAVKKEGDITIGLVGKPSVGKSTLLSKVTNKESKIGAYDFTTLEVIPGLLNHKFVNFQVLDLPGIIRGAAKNKGFGKKVLSVVRVCDLLGLVVDINHFEDISMLIDELQQSGIRVNKQRPNIRITRTSSGGVKIISNFSTSTLTPELIEGILRDNRLMNCEVQINDKNLDIDDFIDAIYENLVYTKAFVILNKCDLKTKEEQNFIVREVKKKYPLFNVVLVSAEQSINLDKLKDFFFDEANFISVYLKQPRKEPDLSRPLIVRRNSSILDVCEKIHRDFLKKFNFAKIKGSSAKFDWQRVGLEHRVDDNDIIEINLK